MATATTRQHEAVVAEKAAYTGEPTARMKAAAAAINAGKSVEVAMREAGYGKGYIAGSAKTFPGVLASVGLLTEAKAKKASPAPVAAETAAKPEPEMIR